MHRDVGQSCTYHAKLFARSRRTALTRGGDLVAEVKNERPNSVLAFHSQLNTQWISREINRRSTAKVINASTSGSPVEQ